MRVLTEQVNPIASLRCRLGLDDAVSKPSWRAVAPFATPKWLTVHDTALFGAEPTLTKSVFGPFADGSDTASDEFGIWFFYAALSSCLTSFSYFLILESRSF